MAKEKKQDPVVDGFVDGKFQRLGMAAPKRPVGVEPQMAATDNDEPSQSGKEAETTKESSEKPGTAAD